MRIRQKWKKWVLLLFLWNIVWAIAINITSKAVIVKQYELGIKVKPVPHQKLTEEDYKAIKDYVDREKALRN